MSNRGLTHRTLCSGGCPTNCTRIYLPLPHGRLIGVGDGEKKCLHSLVGSRYSIEIGWKSDMPEHGNVGNGSRGSSSVLEVWGMMAIGQREYEMVDIPDGCTMGEFLIHHIRRDHRWRLSSNKTGSG